jgi:hypothetical protein
MTDAYDKTVRCTRSDCEFAEQPRSKQHAKALGRRHWNCKGHAVFVDGDEE